MAGAGPAGLAIALMLARQGRRVVVHERFETPRPVGAGFTLQPTGLHVLDRIGLGKAARAVGAPIRRLFGRERRSGRVVLDVDYGRLKSEPPLGVQRSSLFNILFQACQTAGVEFETDFDVAGVDDGRLMNTTGRPGARFDLVIDATGSRSPIARSLGARRRDLDFGALWLTTPWPDGTFAPDALAQVYRGAAKMAGVMPTGLRPDAPGATATFFWSLKGTDHSRWQAEGVDRWKDEVLDFWPDLQPVLANVRTAGDLTFTRYGHHTLSHPVRDRLAVIGDAAHSTSPQLGQGVNMALLDAMALADALERQADLETALNDYARVRFAHVRLYQAISEVFTPLYQSEDAFRPWVRDHVLSHLTRLPLAPRFIAATAAGLLLDPRSR